MLPNRLSPRRVAITGLGLVSPLGNSLSTFWSALAAGQSGVARCEISPTVQTPLKYAGVACEFSGKIDNFGPLPANQKKAIRKGLKLMCRETQMAVAAAQHALASAGLSESTPAVPERSGIVLGSDYMLTMPADYIDSMEKCVGEKGGFQFNRWGNEGLGEMAPLWMLKYLPNMPASHIAILNDLRGPNNSLTMRESSSNLAVGEAFRTIQRGHADCMVAGATGTRILPMQALHALQTEQMADETSIPAEASRPFDKARTGMVAGEGAGMLVLEEMDTARERGAKIYAEVLGAGSSLVADRKLKGNCQAALANAIKATLRDARINATELGHINAHGLSTTESDVQEFAALEEALGPTSSQVPLIAPKSSFGNLGAGSGSIELIASLLAFEHGRLPRVLNYQTQDPACPVQAVTSEEVPPGTHFLNLSVTPQGQAAALCIGISQ
jgi:3-oxoacyl-[acyl-carrier-protein] synthase II